MPKTGLYVLQGIDPAEIAAAPFDVKVIDGYDDNGLAWTPAQVQQMGGGPGGGLLLGYFSIGEAENYRDYFSTIPPAVLGPADPDWPGDYQVAYWTAEWRAIATGYVDRLITAGYDGVFLDVVDEYRKAWARTNVPGGGAANAAQAMADLVKYLADYAHQQNPDFQIWANGAEELLTNATYFNALDGMFKESLFYTDTGQKQPAPETQYSLDLLQPMTAAGKDVIAVEYVSGVTAIEDVETQAAQNGLGYYVTSNINLVGVDYEGLPPGPIPCYCRGTLILTSKGERPVEALVAGDLVCTADGRRLPISWLGRRTVATRFADPLRTLPIRIRAGALGDDVPSRDLLLSPDHAVLVGDVLVQAGALVNGSSIVRDTGVPASFTYYHVEVDEHALILAENTPAETFIDNIDRLSFDNWAEHAALYPDGKPIVEMPYPRAKAHRQVPRAVRALVAQRAAVLGPHGQRTAA